MRGRRGRPCPDAGPTDGGPRAPTTRCSRRWRTDAPQHRRPRSTRWRCCCACSRLPTVARHAEEVAQKAEREGWTFGQYLRHLVALEVEERRRRRIERNLRASELPGEKTLATLDRKRLPAPVAQDAADAVRRRLRRARRQRAAVRPAGRGKTHVACAIGHELVRRGHRVLFTPTYALVQRLLGAKRDLRLEKELRGAGQLRRGDPATTSATCSRAATRWRCSSRSWPSGTSARA